MAEHDLVGESTVHVIDGSAGAASIACAAATARRSGGPVVLVGTSCDDRLARSLGLNPMATFAPPLGELTLALRSWRLVFGRVLAEGASVERATCWSVTTAAATRRVMPQLDVTYISLAGPEPGLALALTRRFPSFRPGTVVALSDAAAEGCRRALGVEPVREAAAVDASLVRRDRERIRGRWGARPDEFIVGLLGEPCQAVDARRAAEIVGIAAVRGANVRLVVHPLAARARRTERWISEIDVAPFYVRDAAIARPWEIVAGLDAALVLRDGVTVAGVAARGPRRAGIARFWSLTEAPMSPLPALWAEAGGVPLLVEDGALDDDSVARLASSSGAWTFASDDPLAATRTVLAWSRGQRESVVAS